MAKTCFCGCGRNVPKFPIGMRSINTRGQQVSERLSLLEDDYPHMAGENEELAAWVKSGQVIRTELTEAVHGEKDARSLDEGAIREWQAEGQKIERFINQQVAALGKWVREEGWTPGQLQQELARGVKPPYLP